MIKEYQNIAIMVGERNISYSQLLDYINLFSTYTPQGKGDKTLVFSENREGWIYAFFSIWQNKGVAVPVDASSTVSDVVYILKDCKPQCIWTSKERLSVAEEAVKESGMPIKILLIDDYEQVSCPQKEGKLYIQEDGIFTAENKEMALIIYTSGTTGSPKGVMISYANLYANCHSVTVDVPIFDSTRRTLILLPLHHVLPLVGTVIMPILAGGGVAICPTLSGPDIMDTLVKGKIAIFVGVPRLWTTIYLGIKKKIDASPVARALFKLCEVVNSPKLSRIIFKAVHQKLGGNLTYCVSGGASLDTEIGCGLRTLGITMLEGYGMTETAPIISFTRPGDVIPGCVGKPMSTVDVKIVNGEICVKGPNVMLGYYNRPEETAQVIDQDGYVHTGDLGYLDELGRIHITGRSKEIIVLSNGKNIQPAELEYKLEKYDQYVKEVAVTQDGDMLRAIIVPKEEWAANLSDAEVEEQLKRLVIEPYNLTVVNYKKVMSLSVFRGALPRTKLDKLQRFKLKDLIKDIDKAEAHPLEKPQTNETLEMKILRKYIEEEKKVIVKPTSHIETDLAFDSLDCVSLEGFIERTFGVQIKSGTFAQYANIQEIADYIAQYKTRSEVENIDWHSILSSDTSSLNIASTWRIHTKVVHLMHKFLRNHNDLEINGIENLPLGGQFIMAPNHQSAIDGNICTAGLSDYTLRNTYYYATEEHIKGYLLQLIARHNNVILMQHQNLKDSILRMAKVLKMGKNIVIFPEGARTHDGQMQTFKKTFAILSKELDIPIIPVRIEGAYEAMPRGTKHLGRNKITVTYLPVIKPTEDITYQQLSDKVRNAILGK
ncbi:MAG: AMP-binding protein [Bacteroidaceae bacterium]|nr:AMP-binding protein [Bacteroidaceae bacterium]